MKRLALGAVMLAVGFIAFTWWALEAGGVAIVETTDAAGERRETHVWFAERAGELWIEAGAPENGWFIDVQRQPQLRVRMDDVVTEYLAVPVRNEAERVALRAALHAKYGFRDTWVGLFVDSSHSVPVRLEPLAP